MMGRTLLVGFTVVGLAGAASADIKTFSPAGGSGDWNNANNWSPSGVPTGTTRVVIPSGKTCTVTANATADTMDVDGTLEVDPGVTLQFENNTDNLQTPAQVDHHVVDGDVVVQTSTGGGAGTIAFTTYGTHIIAGNGSIEGSLLDTNAPPLPEFEIASGKKVVNRLDQDDEGVRGTFTIQAISGDATFRNEGLVESTGLIVLASSMILEDIDGARWVINHCKGSSAMRFDREALGLQGDFIQTLGSNDPFTFNQKVKTCGAWIRNGGALEIASGKSFAYVEYIQDDPFGICENPGNHFEPGEVTCSNPDVVTSSQDACFNCAE